RRRTLRRRTLRSRAVRRRFFILNLGVDPTRRTPIPTNKRPRRLVSRRSLLFFSQFARRQRWRPYQRDLLIAVDRRSRAARTPALPLPFQSRSLLRQRNRKRQQTRHFLRGSNRTRRWRGRPRWRLHLLPSGRGFRDGTANAMPPRRLGAFMSLHWVTE